MVVFSAMVQAASLLASLQGNHKTEIDGQTYRVNIRGSTVSVFKKSLIVVQTPEVGAAMRKAVTAATGCAMKDGFWQGLRLTGTLDCSQHPTN
ncbi:hypothetical protein JYA60_01350 [Sphingomonas yabuuchiae]|nr:hypothetical protein [Sphingomonas yabuuchiae]